MWYIEIIKCGSKTGSDNMLGIWIIMTIFSLLIPLTMLGFGSYFSKQAPAEINYVFGYRTRRSMQNSDTWIFAHHYCGKLWKTLGLILLSLTIISMIFVYGRSIEIISTVGGVITGLQTVVLVISIFPTENALKKTFDDNGMRKDI